MKPIILFSTLWLLVNAPPIETVNLQILHKDKMVGQFSAQRSKFGDLTVYQSHSTVGSNKLRVQISYEIRVVLQKGVLQESDLTMTINGRLRTHSQTRKDGDIYTFYKNGKNIGEIQEEITHTTIMLYFDEPIDIRKTYSEEQGNFCKILRHGSQTYQKINSKGKINTYRYSANSLRYLLIKNNLIDFEMISKTSDHQPEE